MSVESARLIPPEQELTLGQKVVRTVVALCALALVCALLWLLRFLVTPVVLAFLMSYVLGPLVDLMEDRGLPRWAAVLICFGVGLGLLVGVGAALWPSLDTWLKETPKVGEKSVFEIQLAKRLDEWEGALSGVYHQVDWRTIFRELRDVLETQRKGLMEGLPKLALAALSNAGTFLLAPIIGLFILLDGSSMQKAVVSLVPNRYFETVLVLLHRVDRQIAAYLRGAASESGLVALLLTVALFAVGMPNALLFACIYGAANVIPLAGPVIGTGAGLLFSLLDPNAPSAGVLLAAYGAVYVVDAMFINPLVVGKNLNLHPLTIIVGISIGGNLAGILGMLVIIPLIAIGKAILGTVMDALRQRALV
ncbi:MAG: AI-2E family transporter [Myxococcota bacterium]